MAAIGGKLIIIIGSIIALIGWAVALGGTAKFTDVCDDWNSSGFCARAYQYEWWGIWFSFILVIIILILAFLGNSNWNTTLQSFLAACVSVTMLDACTSINLAGNYYNNNNGNGRGNNRWDDDLDAAADAMAAGFVILSFGLFLLIIALGMGQTAISINFRTSGGGKVSPKDDKVEKSPESA